jgi:hypothetical protein
VVQNGARVSGDEETNKSPTKSKHSPKKSKHSPKKSKHSSSKKTKKGNGRSKRDKSKRSRGSSSPAKRSKRKRSFSSSGDSSSGGEVEDGPASPVAAIAPPAVDEQTPGTGEGGLVGDHVVQNGARVSGDEETNKNPVRE